jgi:hypothetical protein
MLLFLLIVPVTILSIWWLYRRSKRVNNQSPAVQTTVGAATQAEAPEVADRHVEILAAAVQLPVGDDPKMMLERINDLPRPGLHPRLQDQNGFPIFASFAKDMGFRVSESSFQQFAVGVIEDEQLRAIALLEPVVDQLLQEALAQMPSLPAVEERVVAGLKRTIEPESYNILHITLLLPARWGDTLRDVGNDWLKDKALTAGFDEKQLHMEVMLAAGPADVWCLIDRLGFTESGDRRHWHLLLGCESLISQMSFERLRGMEQLMTDRSTAGVLPGEGAAGMLLRCLKNGETPVAESPVFLHRVMAKAMDQNISSRGASRVLSDLIVQSLSDSKVESEAIAHVISDADQQRSGQAAEIGAGIIAACPDLDISSQWCDVGSVTGCIGHVAPLVVIGLAYAKAAYSRQPVLALGIIGNQERVALVISSTVSSPEVGPMTVG